LVTSVLEVPFRWFVPVPKYTSAGDQTPVPASLASIRTLYDRLLTADPMR
jgi:hypothetical protein